MDEMEKEITTVLFHDWKKYIECQDADWGIETGDSYVIELTYDLSEFLFRSGLLNQTYYKNFKDKQVWHDITGIGNLIYLSYKNILEGNHVKVIEITKQEANYIQLQITVTDSKDENPWDMLIDYSGSYSVISFPRNQK